METGKIVLIWLGISGLTDFAAMGTDKRRAIRHQRRTPETTLLLWGLVGGAWGGWLGMRLFHHKTRHLHFRIGFPMMVFLQAALLLWLHKTGVI